MKKKKNYNKQLFFFKGWFTYITHNPTHLLRQDTTKLYIKGLIY